MSLRIISSVSISLIINFLIVLPDPYMEICLNVSLHVKSPRFKSFISISNMPSSHATRLILFTLQFSMDIEFDAYISRSVYVDFEVLMECNGWCEFSPSVVFLLKNEPSILTSGEASFPFITHSLLTIDLSMQILGMSLGLELFINSIDIDFISHEPKYRFLKDVCLIVISFEKRVLVKDPSVIFDFSMNIDG